MQADDSGFRIAEDASDCRARTETGKAVRVPQAMVFWHPKSIPDLRIPEYRENTSKHIVKSLFSAIIYLLAREKSHKYEAEGLCPSGVLEVMVQE